MPVFQVANQLGPAREDVVYRLSQKTLGRGLFLTLFQPCFELCEDWLGPLDSEPLDLIG